MTQRLSWTVLNSGAAFAVAGLAGAWTLGTSLTDADLVLPGEALFDFAGTAVSPAGDFDGDGYDDFLVGAPWNDDGGGTAGQTYLVLGSDSGWGNSLADADGSYLGESAYDESGTALGRAGDVNDDGFDDVLIGARNNDRGGNNAGAAYLIHGSASGWGLDLDLGTVATVYVGEHTQDHAGCSVAGAGDVNDDGFDDFLVGADGSDDNGPSAGQAYLVLGGAMAALEVDLSAVDGTFVGEFGWDLAGKAVAGAGNVDGDAFDDLLIAAPGSDAGGNYSGQVYLVLGHGAGWSVDAVLASADASFVGESTNDFAGEAIAGVGDVDGDGLDDFVIGAWGSAAGGSEAGQTYLILGRTTGWAAGVDLGTTDASFVGEAAGDESGSALSGAGDLNGDGLSDFLIGARGSDTGGSGAGEIYVVLGLSGAGWGPGLDLGQASASFLGEAIDDLAGTAVAGIGDFDGDGFDDLLVGVPDSDAAGTDVGQAYVVLGEGSCVDRDGDGFGSPGAAQCPGGAMDDCDDRDPSSHPGATEQCDGVDNNCDGIVVYDEADSDADGWMYCEGDCDDADPVVNPGAAEICDGLDTDCDGARPADESDTDGDGYMICEGDCNDGHVDVNPGATETCDGEDEDCDGSLPPDEADADGDGTMVCEGDCDDTDAMVNPGAAEACNGIDDDCDGAPAAFEADADADGWMECEDDCNDDDANVHPEAVEVCDGMDTDCDGVVPADEEDHDADGYRDCDGDCDDFRDDVHPDAVELCDGADNDCDGTVRADEADGDGDGDLECAGDCDDEDPAMNLDDLDGDGFSTCDGDCDDAAAEVHPDVDEDCGDGVDNDCDGLVDLDDLEECAPPADDDDATESDDDDATEDGDGVGVSSDCECRVGASRPDRGPWGVAVLALLLVAHRR